MVADVLHRHGQPPAAIHLHRHDEVMGTVVSIDVTAHPQHQVTLAAALDEAVALLHEAEDRFTTFRPSEWCRYAAGELDLDAAHPDIRHVALRCAELVEESGGAFTVTANPRVALDPAAYVKGWAGQRAAEHLQLAGADRGCVNLGGDVAVWGGRPRWRIGIQDPARSDVLAGVVELVRGAVATSGRYERGDHLVDGRTGQPATCWASVTVVGADLGDVDADATVAFALGPDAPAWLGDRPGRRALLIDHDGHHVRVGW